MTVHARLQRRMWFLLSGQLVGILGFFLGQHVSGLLGMESSLISGPWLILCVVSGLGLLALKCPRCRTTVPFYHLHKQDRCSHCDLSFELSDGSPEIEFKDWEQEVMRNGGRSEWLIHSAVVGYYAVLVAIGLVSHSDMITSIAKAMGVWMLGALFVLAYFYEERCALFRKLIWLCKNFSSPPGRRTAFVYFAICLLAGCIELARVWL